jgi:hypothetical protein
MEQDELLKRVQELEEKIAKIESHSPRAWINPRPWGIDGIRHYFTGSIRKKYFLLLAIFLPITLLLATAITKPNTFKAGDKISATKINENFDAIYNQVNSMDGSISSQGIPIGTIVTFGGNTTPTGWFLCNGQSVSRTTYAALFNTIGTAYGNGDGSTTFNVPDFRGKFLRGLDGTAGVDPDSGASSNAGADGKRYALNGGNTGNSLGSVQLDGFQGHWHQLMIYPNDGYYGASNGNDIRGQSAIDNTYVRNPISDGTNGTPRYTSETRPKNVYVNFIVKY